MRPRPLAIFGGTFDPLHNGHLLSARELQQQLQFEQVRLMPAAQPPHRELPGCTATDRASMVELAVRAHPGLSCDRRELAREGPSYSVTSLAEIRAEEGRQRSISLVVGADIVAALDSWYRWESLLELAHILVLARPDYELPQAGKVADWMRRYLTGDPATLQHRPGGAVFVQELTPCDVSSTRVRQALARGEETGELVPAVVAQYIEEHGLYRPHGPGGALCSQAN